jgi:hypothetical protein
LATGCGVAASGSTWAQNSGRDATSTTTAAAPKVDPTRARAGATRLVYVRKSGAERCPDEEVLRFRTVGGFGQLDPFVKNGTDAPWTLRVVLSPEGKGFAAEMSHLDASGEPVDGTTVRYDNCDGLVWAAAYEMTLAIGPFPSPPPACPACPACPKPPAPPPPEPRCDAACMQKVEKALCEKYGRCMDLTLAVMAGGLMSAGLTLEVGPGAWLGFEVKRDWFSIGVEVRGMFPAAAQRYFASPPNSDFFSFSGLLVPCARWKWLFGCAFVEAGSFVFTIPGGSKGDYSNLLLSVGPRAGVDVPIGAGFSGRAFADLAIRPYLPGVTVTDLNDPDQPTLEWRLPLASGFFGLGIAWAR